MPKTAVDPKAKEKTSKKVQVKAGTKAPAKTKEPKEKVAREYDPLKGDREPILKALMKLKAISPTDAVDADKIAEKAALTKEKVKHYCYKEGDLVKNGFVGIAQGNGRALLYHLTTSGAKLVSKSA